MHVCSIDWYFGRSVIGVFKKNKPSIITISPILFMCDVCGGRCGRGRKGNDYNKCKKEVKDLQKV